MVTAEHICALIRAHASGDSRRFYTVALGTAASLAREGNTVGALKVRDAVDTAQAMKDLPLYSGPFCTCTKCATAPNGIEPYPVGAKYIRSDEREFMERECKACGHVWYETCADVRKK